MKKLNLSTVCLVVLVAAATQAHASGGAAPAQTDGSTADSTADVRELTVASVSVERVAEPVADQQTAVSRYKASLNNNGRRIFDESALDKFDVALDKIINIGEKIWNLAEKGKPVVNVSQQTATALPQGITDWNLMEGWQAPRTRLYRLKAKNLYGITVVDFTYRVLYVAGGSYKGSGQYLARISVQPENLSVAWGYNFEANTEVPTVVNVGSVAAPIGGAEVYVNWKMSTILKESRGSGSYFVTGAGEFRDSDK